MSESDEGKPKEFFQVRMLVDVAKARVRTSRKALEIAEKEHRRRRATLQVVCPHQDITECEQYFEDATRSRRGRDRRDYTDIWIPTRRRCGDCGKLEEQESPDRKLFARDPDRTVTPEEFSQILRDDVA